MDAEKIKKFFSKTSLRNFWIFFGSGLIVSMAYMDPGNWGTNIEGGSTFNYALLWAIWLANGMAMFFQYLSGKIGIAGYSLSEIVKDRIKTKWKVFIYWLGAEVSILATDLAEFLGIVVALNILFGVPLLIGSFISILEILFFFALTKKSFRAVEKAFIWFVSIISLAFVYELFLAKPEFSQIIFHSVVPNLNSSTIFIVVGIIGATIMPHALFIHSWLIKNKLKESKAKDKKRFLKFHVADTIISLTVAGIVNAAMLIMAASAFYQKGIIATLSQAYYTLVPLFGEFAAIVFGSALLISGMASSITGTLAGQSIMEGLTRFRIGIFTRRVITRFINMIPLTAAILLGLEPLKVLVYSQVILSILIPLPLIPIILFTSDKKIMGNLVNKKWTTIFAWTLSALIIALNVYLITTVF
jgi:manganese transport protein